jgi:hypothetical protein
VVVVAKNIDHNADHQILRFYAASRDESLVPGILMPISNLVRDVNTVDVICGFRQASHFYVYSVVVIASDFRTEGRGSNPGCT